MARLTMDDLLRAHAPVYCLCVVCGTAWEKADGPGRPPKYCGEACRTAQKAAYYAENADRIRERQAAYFRTPEGRATAVRSGAKRRALKRGAEAPLTAAEWAAILDRYEGRCYVCAAPAEELEHVVPLSRGGSHSFENVRPSCRECNRGAGGKLARPFAEWLPTRLDFLAANVRPVNPTITN